MLNLDRLSIHRDPADLDALGQAALDRGIKFSDIEVINDRGNLIVRLIGSDVIVRSPGSTRLVRGPEAIERELAVGAYLRDNHMPVVPPVIDHPVESDGLIFSFWQAIDEDGSADAEKVGWALRSCHEALESFDQTILADWSIIDETITILEDERYILAIAEEDRKRAVIRGKEIKQELFVGQLLPVHGDAHWRNVIHSKEGPLWNDWEDVHLAPRSWDLACLRSSSWFDRKVKQDARIALEAYGPQPDLALAKKGRTLEHIAWGSLLAVHYQEDLVEHQAIAKQLVDSL